MGSDAVEVRPARDDAEIEGAKELRLRVFSHEQGVAPEAEVDGLDPAATHLVAVRSGAVVGTCRLRFSGRRCKLERMVVERSLRQTGIGRELLAEAEREAVRQGADEMIMHAQRQVEGFYAACGYETQGEAFLEEGIPHVLMRKPLMARTDERSGGDQRT